MKTVSHCLFDYFTHYCFTDYIYKQQFFSCLFVLQVFPASSSAGRDGQEDGPSGDTCDQPPGVANVGSAVSMTCCMLLLQKNIRELWNFNFCWSILLIHLWFFCGVFVFWKKKSFVSTCFHFFPWYWADNSWKQVALHFFWTGSQDFSRFVEEFSGWCFLWLLDLARQNPVWRQGHATNKMVYSSSYETWYRTLICHIHVYLPCRW